MRVFRDFFLVTAAAESSSVLPIKGYNGEFLTLDTKFDPVKHSTRIGRISSVPLDFSEKSIDSNTVKMGDKVLFHHFVVQPHNAWLIDRKTYYKAIWEHVWAKIEFDKLIPLNDWVFVEPIREEESALFCDTLKLKEYTENISQTGIVFASSGHCKLKGLFEGTKIHFIKDADYEIKFGDKIFWRMKLGAVLTTENDGEIYPLANQILVEQDEQPDKVEKVGLLMPENQRRKELSGTIRGVGDGMDLHTQTLVGDRVTYFRGMFGNFNYWGKNYSVLNPLDVIYVG